MGKKDGFWLIQRQSANGSTLKLSRACTTHFRLFVGLGGTKWGSCGFGEKWEKREMRGF